MYLVSAGIEWNFTILSNACGVSHDSSMSISEGQYCVKSSPICSGHSRVVDGNVLISALCERWIIPSGV
jgi:hypothetical protein